MSGPKLVLLVIALTIPTILVLFSFVSQLRGFEFANPEWSLHGFIYLASGIVIYAVEVIAYVYLRNRRRTVPAHSEEQS